MSINNSVLGAIVATTTTPTLTGASPTNPYVCIPFDSIKSGITWDTAVNDNLEPWIAAQVQTLLNFNTAQVAANDASHNIVVQKSTGYSVLNRNGVLKKLYRYTVDVYTSASGGDLPDGDEF